MTHDGAADGSGDAPVGSVDHDEDGDGVVDALDTCPFIAGDQADTDGDGVGDLCDAEPTNPRQHLVLFQDGRSMDGLTFSDPALWSQDPDALHFSAITGAQLAIDTGPYQGVSIALAFDILTVVQPTMQHQVSLHPYASGPDPHDFIELNETGTFRKWAVSHFDGTNYVTVDSQDLAAPIHTGRVDMVGTCIAGGLLELEGGWLPQEVYQASSPTNSNGPASSFHIDINRLELDLRYIWLVTW